MSQGRGMGGHHSQNADTVVWLTPPYILEALGPFDLDPCAVTEPRPWPTAQEHIALPDDGLARDWRGRVWLNPPYGRDVGIWLEKLADHGRGTALIFARTDTAWFTPTVWKRANAVLFLEGRLFFYRPDGTKAAHNSGAPSCLAAYGEEDAERLRISGLPGQFVELVKPTGVFA